MGLVAVQQAGDSVGGDIHKVVQIQRQQRETNKPKPRHEIVDVQRGPIVIEEGQIILQIPSQLKHISTDLIRRVDIPWQIFEVGYEDRYICIKNK